MSEKPCPSEAQLMRLVDAALPPEELTQVTHHLADCAPCSRKVSQLRTVIDGVRAKLASDDPDTLDVEAHVADVMQRLDGPSPAQASPRTVRIAGVSAALAAAAVVLAMYVGRGAPREDDALVARGGPSAASLSRDVGLQLYAQEHSLRALEPGAEIHPRVALTAGLRNLSATPAYLLLFAVDAAHAVHWITPQYTDPAVDPAATRVDPSKEERLLPNAVVFDDLAHGTVRIVSVLSTEPHRVSEVERLPQAALTSDALGQRFPEAEIRQVSLRVTPENKP